MIYYSASTKGFYDSELHTEMPSDVVEISAEDYRALLQGQALGKSIQPDPSTGAPILVDAPPLSAKQLLASYDAQLMHYYDTRAQERNYDSRITCALRAGYPGPFQSEGIAFGTWMDLSNKKCYDILAEVTAGNRPAPSFSEVLAELPQLVWPS